MSSLVKYVVMRGKETLGDKLKVLGLYLLVE